MKKLIEVALPLRRSTKPRLEKSPSAMGTPALFISGGHVAPLATSRAVIFVQMVNDPSEHPKKFPTEEAQEQERQRLFRLIEELVQWENTTNEKVLNQAREGILKSWRDTCEENKNHPKAADLFNPKRLS